MSRKLNQKQMIAIQLLALGQTAKNVAMQLDVCPETISKWKQGDEFNKEMRKVMIQMRDDMRCQLFHLMEQSVRSLAADIHCPGDPALRTKTALNVLKLIGSGSVAIPILPVPELPRPSGAPVTRP